MACDFRYHRPSDRITTGSWSLSTGTARTGYGVTNLENGDPSNPLWITGTSIRAVKDFGSATRVDQVYIFAHTFVNGAALHLQMHTSSSWATPDVDITITIPTAYEDGFSYNIAVDVAAAYPTVGNRTKQFLSIANLSANAVTCAMGEVWVVGSSRTLGRHVKAGVSKPRQRLTSRNMSKKGVTTRYDRGSIQEGFEFTVDASAQDFADLCSLDADAKGDVRSFPIVLGPGDTVTRDAEPMLVRLTSPIFGSAPEFTTLIPVHFSVEALGRGEVLGA